MISIYKKVRVDVTKEHIKTGVPKSCKECMLAKAIKECVATKLPEIRFGGLFYHDAALFNDADFNTYTAYLSYRVHNASIIFDTKGTYKPFYFYLTIEKDPPIIFERR